MTLVTYAAAVRESEKVMPEVSCERYWMMRNFPSSSYWFWDLAGDGLRGRESSYVLEIPNSPGRSSAQLLLCGCWRQALPWSHQGTGWGWDRTWWASVESFFSSSSFFLLNKKSKEGRSDHSEAFWRTWFLKEVPPLEDSACWIPNCVIMSQLI